MEQSEIRELLELAAKAAGYNAKWCDFDGMDIRVGYQGGMCLKDQDCYWNPYHDDGDSRRLEVRLTLSVIHSTGGAAMVMSHDMGVSITETPSDGDSEAATRLAVLRAAAEIGRRMP